MTGGTGFIGRHVVNKLTGSGNELLLLSRRPETLYSNIVQGDLSDIQQWGREVQIFKPDAALHLAWESLPDYSAITSVKNLQHGLNLYAFLADIGCKTIITTGSCWEYGRQSGRLIEDIPQPAPLNAFSAAKNALHWLGAKLTREKEVRFIWTRLFYVYGPRQRPTSLLPYLIRSVREQKFFEIANPEARIDFVYVDDVAEALALLLKKESSEYAVYNIGSGSSTQVKKIIRLVGKFLSERVQYKAMSDSWQIMPNFYADITAIGQRVGWCPQTDIATGIRKTIEFHREQSGI